MARVLYLSKGYVAIVSDSDWEAVSKFNWHVHRSAGTNKKQGQPYARTNINGKKVYLHRLITGAEYPLQVDHKNHQTLDCRRENLLVCDHQTNQLRRRNVKKLKHEQNALDFTQH